MPSSAPQPQSVPKVIVPRQNGLTRNPARPSVTYSLSFIDVDPVFGMNDPSQCTCLDVRPLAKVTQRGGAATKNMCALQTLRWLVAKGTQRSPRLFTIFSVLNSEKLNTEGTKNHREPQRNQPFSFRPAIIFFSGGPQCSLWLFSVSSVLNTEKRDENVRVLP